MKASEEFFSLINSVVNESKYMGAKKIKKYENIKI